MTEKNDNAGENQGIVANRVTAEVLAVGEGATAVKYQLGSQQQADLLTRLDELIDLLQKNVSDETAGKIFTTELQQVKDEAAKAKPDRELIKSLLERFGEKFLLVKNTLKGAAEIIDSIKAIASVLKISLSFLV